MKKQILRFSIHQTSKVLAIMYFVVSAIFTIPMGLYYAFYLKDMTSAASLFIFPFLGAVFYYIFMAIFLALYNLVAKSIGGIEFTLSDTSLNS